jgi:hypothetical protein
MVCSTVRPVPRPAEPSAQPLTNYNIVVLDQSPAHNSYMSLINTNVTRDSQSLQVC